MTFSTRLSLLSLVSLGALFLPIATWAVPSAPGKITLSPLASVGVPSLGLVSAILLIGFLAVIGIRAMAKRQALSAIVGTVVLGGFLAGSAWWAMHSPSVQAGLLVIAPVEYSVEQSAEPVSFELGGCETYIITNNAAAPMEVTEVLLPEGCTEPTPETSVASFDFGTCELGQVLQANARCGLELIEE